MEPRWNELPYVATGPFSVNFAVRFGDAGSAVLRTTVDDLVNNYSKYHIRPSLKNNQLAIELICGYEGRC